MNEKKIFPKVPKQRSLIPTTPTIACLLMVFALLFACTEKPEQKAVAVTEAGKVPFFTVMGFEKTGLQFNNKLKETTYMNGFYYEYFYNGGGIAVADFNNDGLQDIYFTSNLRTNKLFLNQGDLTFKNVSVKAKVQGGYGFSTGVTVVDINNDGLKDIYLLKSGRFDSEEPLRNELYVNLGTDKNNIPIFEERSKRYGLDLPHYSTQASFFDFDRDGDLDMFLINHNTEVYAFSEMDEFMKAKSDKIGAKLYRNDQGRFVNVTERAGIISNKLGFGLGLGVGDVNNDGWPDVYTSNDYYEKDHLYINNHDGTFKETSRESFGHIPTFSMGNDIADINNDGYLDIISLDMMAEDNFGQKASMSGMNIDNFHTVEKKGLHHQYMYNALQLNNGNSPKGNIPVFSDIAQLAQISSTDWSWAPLLFDMDNDGNRDLFVSNGIKRDFRDNDFSIYTEKKYHESAKRKKVSLAKHVDDLLDKLPTRNKQNYFYHNKGNLTFERINVEQVPTSSNGAAYADFDNDGDLDIVVNNTDDFAQLYRNDQDSGAYVSFDLKGPKGNRDAIGARIEISTDDHRTLIAENYFTRGFQSAMAIPLHFGLGSAKKVVSAKVLWPDGTLQQVPDVPINTKATITYAPNGIWNPTPDLARNFHDITTSTGVNFRHLENSFNDFSDEILLPHKMSEEGPALAVGDVNADGLDDFFIGGAKNHAGALYLQDRSGRFTPSNQSLFTDEKKYEDVDALFFDVDNDEDLDLFVVSGGNEVGANGPALSDRVYINKNGTFHKTTDPFGNDTFLSGSVIRPHDFDGDGDLDLFVGTRQLPGRYPFSAESKLLRNDSENGEVKFTDLHLDAFKELGMVTDARWTDIDGDKNKELVLVGEWMPLKIIEFENDKFVDITQKSVLGAGTGWWFAIEAADFDKDGDIDLVAGNLGLNGKYKASETAPFEVFANDFDQNGTLDIVLGYHQEGKLFPLRGRQCSSDQMPFIKKKFPSYSGFASAELVDVYGKENMNSALHLKATDFASCYYENDGHGKFTARKLPNLAQTTAVRSIIADDIDADGNLDLVLMGNFYGFEVETPRQDAGYGMYLKGDGKGNFIPQMPYESGLYVRGNVAKAQKIVISGKGNALIVAKNNGFVQFLNIL